VAMLVCKYIHSTYYSNHYYKDTYLVKENQPTLVWQYTIPILHAR